MPDTAAILREQTQALIQPEEISEILQSTVENSAALRMMTRLPNMATNVREYPIDVPENHITVLKGVLLDTCKAVNMRTDSLEGTDAVTLHIPFDVAAADGITGQAREFVPPEVFRELEDKSGVWTLTAGNTFFVKNEVIEPEAGRGDLEKYRAVYSVTKVSERDFGTPDMRHWEVGGK